MALASPFQSTVELHDDGIRLPGDGAGYASRSNSLPSVLRQVESPWSSGGMLSSPQVPFSAFSHEEDRSPADPSFIWSAQPPVSSDRQRVSSFSHSAPITPSLGLEHSPHQYTQPLISPVLPPPPRSYQSSLSFLSPYSQINDFALQPAPASKRDRPERISRPSATHQRAKTSPYGTTFAHGTSDSSHRSYESLGLMSAPPEAWPSSYGRPPSFQHQDGYLSPPVASDHRDGFSFEVPQWPSAGDAPYRHFHSRSEGSGADLARFESGGRTFDTTRISSEEQQSPVNLPPIFSGGPSDEQDRSNPYLSDSLLSKDRAYSPSFPGIFEGETGLENGQGDGSHPPSFLLDFSSQTGSTFPTARGADYSRAQHPQHAIDTIQTTSSSSRSASSSSPSSPTSYTAGLGYAPDRALYDSVNRPSSASSSSFGEASCPNTIADARAVLPVSITDDGELPSFIDVERDASLCPSSSSLFGKIEDGRSVLEHKWY